MKIAIVGAPSCRKSTTADQVNVMLKTQKYNSAVCEEYARTYILRYGPMTVAHEQLIVLLKQVEKEEELSKVHDIVICDTASWLSYIYCSMLLRQTNEFTSIKGRKLLGEIHKRLLRVLHTYDLTFYMPIQESVVKDGVRVQTDEDRIIIDNKIKGFMSLHDIPYTWLTGPVEEKADYMLGVILDKKGDIAFNSRVSL